MKTNNKTEKRDGNVKLYTIYRRSVTDKGVSRWIQTAHSVQARTSVEAQAKTRRKFKGCGFSNMSLVASRFDPNLLPENTLLVNL